MKSKSIVFRVDPGTYRQIHAEATRRGLSVSGYARLMCTAPFVEAGPPDMRALALGMKDLIAESQEITPAEARTQLQHFKQAVEAVISVQGKINDAARWLVNIGNTLDVTTMQKRSAPDASPGHAGGHDTPDAG
jgi:hypothetical protein